ncbi:MAG: Holliday junction resolvase RuvX [Puniceicoccales bacterium]|jgi:putative Holliday junction resolvase|nr:Holliday junction resolvase RuvX [Puniceicoccales bacterium]
MANFLGIDYGQRRIGLSCGDPAIGVAIPCRAIICSDGVSFWEELEQIVREKRISAFVVGWPLASDGAKTAWTVAVEEFAQRLREHFNMPVYLSDERLTSYQVTSDRKSFGLQPAFKHIRRERNSGDNDSRAAALLLQDFFDEQCKF